MNHSRLSFILFSGLGLLASLSAQTDDFAEREQDFTTEAFTRGATEKSTKAKLDPKRIINASSSFLKEREPEMTGEEQALYDSIATMIVQKPQFALKLLEAMVNEKEKPSPAFEFILGNAYYAAGESAKAEASYRRALDRYPTFLRAWNNLGVLYYSTERFEEAAKCFSKSVSLGDRDSVTYGLLGYSLEQEKDFLSSEVAYMQALAGDSTNVEWKEGLLRIYLQGSQFARAESVVKNLIKIQPKETRFWLLYANILVAEGKKLQAAAVLDAAAGLGVAGADELGLLGDLYAEQKLYEEATAIYRKILTPAPATGHDKLLHFAQVLIADGKFPEAERVLGTLNADLPPATSLVFLQTKADLLAAKKQWPDARRELETLLKAAPFNGRALLSLGRTYTAEDDLARAVFAFEAAYRVPDTTYRASLELANLQLKNRDYAMSVKYLEKALSIQKTDAVEDYLARIRTLVAKDG